MANSKRKPGPARTSPARNQAGRATTGPSRTKPKAAPPRSSTTGSARSVTGGETPLRMAVADRSRGLVVVLARQPKLLIPAVMLVLMLVGLMAPIAYGVPALAIVALFVCWLAFLSWPVIDARQRAIRVVMIAVVVIAAVGRVAGWF